MSDMTQLGYSSIVLVTIDGYEGQLCANLEEAYDVLGIDKPHELPWVDERKTRHVELVGIGRIDVIYH